MVYLHTNTHDSSTVAHAAVYVTERSTVYDRNTLESTLLRRTS